MPKTDYEKNNFDIDLDFGRKGEDWVIEVFEGSNKIEVKTERGIWKNTGNIAIEIEYRGRPSGLTTTNADIWIHLLEYEGKIVGGFLLPIELLKKKFRTALKGNTLKTVMGGDENASKLMLLPIKEVFE